jgi:hypothetical protein
MRNLTRTFAERLEHEVLPKPRILIIVTNVTPSMIQPSVQENQALQQAFQPNRHERIGRSEK